LRTPRLLAAGAPREPGPARAAHDGAGAAADGRDTWSLAEVEKDHILRVLRRHHGNASAAARQLAVSRTTLWRKLRQYGLKREDLEGPW
jgi:transcriptional regulator of acetoin/glycerol metabolism